MTGPPAVTVAGSTRLAIATSAVRVTGTSTAARLSDGSGSVVVLATVAAFDSVPEKPAGTSPLTWKERVAPGARSP